MASAMRASLKLIRGEAWRRAKLRVPGRAFPSRRLARRPAAGRVVHADPADHARRQRPHPGGLAPPGSARLPGRRDPSADRARRPVAAAHHPDRDAHRTRSRRPAGGADHDLPAAWRRPRPEHVHRNPRHRPVAGADPRLGDARRRVRAAGRTPARAAYPAPGRPARARPQPRQHGAAGTGRGGGACRRAPAAGAVAGLVAGRPVRDARGAEHPRRRARPGDARRQPALRARRRIGRRASTRRVFDGFARRLGQRLPRARSIAS